MRRKLRIAYLAHSLRSDWNNGNAHFLRGLLRELAALGHDVEAFEPERGWSIENLETEPEGAAAQREFAAVYPDLRISLYRRTQEIDEPYWRDVLKDFDIVILHEWNSPALAQLLLGIRADLRWKLLFHDTHHRASSSPDQIRQFGTDQFDGVLAFGEALRNIYRERFGIGSAWTLHEAADTTVFRPLKSGAKRQDVVWIGNWGDDERSREICEFLLKPASAMRNCTFAIYGVRYPDTALGALQAAGARFGGYLPNLRAPAVYAESRLTVHVPRQQYTQAMTGIPTIRVFEALACGIPLISAPWKNTEHLFREGDFLFASNGEQMRCAMEHLLGHPGEAREQALQGLETIVARHTCRHRAEQLTDICEEILE